MAEQCGCQKVAVVEGAGCDEKRKLEIKKKPPQAVSLHLHSPRHGRGGLIGSIDIQWQIQRHIVLIVANGTQKLKPADALYGCERMSAKGGPAFPLIAYRKTQSIVIGAAQPFQVVLNHLEADATVGHGQATVDEVRQCAIQIRGNLVFVVGQARQHNIGKSLEQMEQLVVEDLFGLLSEGGGCVGLK